MKRKRQNSYHHVLGFLFLCLLVFSASLLHAAENAETDAESAAAEPQSIRLGGSSILIENVFKRITEPFEKKTGIKLDLVECDPVAAWSGMMRGDFDAALTDSTSMFKLNWREMLSISDSDTEPPNLKLSWHAIDADDIAIFTHPGVKLKTLPPADIKAVFTGKYANWSIFGGPSLPITVILPQQDNTILEDFSAGALDGADFSKNARFVKTPLEAKQETINTPGAISLGALALAEDATVNLLAVQSSRRQLSLIWKWDAWKGESVKKLYNYIQSEEGRKHILFELKK